MMRACINPSRRPPMSPTVRYRLLLSGNCIARAVLKAALRPTLSAARADLRRAFTAFVDIAHCLKMAQRPMRRAPRRRQGAQS